MTKRRALNIIAGKRQKGIRARYVVIGSSGATKAGVFYVDASTAGIENGTAYITIDTAGTSTQISD